MRFVQIDQRFAQMHKLIESKNTGSASDFAKKLKIGKSTLYRYLKIIELDYYISVEYDSYINSFIYPKNMIVSYGGTFSFTNKKEVLPKNNIE